MKRKKLEKDDREGLQKWINSGRSAARIWINGKLKMIKPNQKFKALEEEVPVAFRDKIKCLDGVVDTPAPTSHNGKDIPNWELKEVDGGFDVVDTVGKQKANTIPLDKEAAENLLKEKKA